MKSFDIFIAYMSWGNAGKSRPVLVFTLGDNIVDIYQITTKYEDKSAVVRAQYFKIEDWQQAGLNIQSYVDTGTLITLPINIFKDKAPIGKLTDADKQRLFNFLNNL